MTTAGDAGSPQVSRTRRHIGISLALVLFVSLLSVPMPALTGPAHRLGAVLTAVVVLWVTEALPLALTGLLGIIACALLQVAPVSTLVAPFADPLILLLIASFVLVRALFVHGLDRRLAHAVLSLSWIEGHAARLLLAFGAITFLISSVVSNAATTAMMYAIALSIITMMPHREPSALRFAAGLMLMATHAASFGGLATPVGTPPNLMGLAFIQRFTGYHLTFLRWSLLALPIVVVLFTFLYFFLRNRSITKERLAIGLGPLAASKKGFTRAEKSTIFAWTVTLVLWITPGASALLFGEGHPIAYWLQRLFPESIAALCGMALLLLLPGHGRKPALSLKEAAGIDWEIVLLYATGFAFGVATSYTGLAGAIGKNLAGNIPEVTPFVFLLGSTFAAALVSEFSSNTSSANIIVPVVISVAQAAGVDPIAPALGATFGASLGFMLPVSTPGNAIVYASGYVPLGKMMRYGIVLDIVGTIVIAVCIQIFFPFLR